MERVVRRRTLEGPGLPKMAAWTRSLPDPPRQRTRPPRRPGQIVSRQPTAQVRTEPGAPGSRYRFLMAGQTLGMRLATPLHQKRTPIRRRKCRSVTTHTRPSFCLPLRRQRQPSCPQARPVHRTHLPARHHNKPSTATRPCLRCLRAS
jgi:hypothetical protein